MLLDHFNSFADFQPVGLLLDFPFAVEAPAPAPRKRSGGFAPDTLVETDRGFVQARDVKPGDIVYTFDGGCQEVQHVRHAVPRMTTMMYVPAGALGNDCDINLPADQMVALELDEVERLFGVPVVLVKLISLSGYKGIKAVAPNRMGRIHIECAEEELLWAESGMLMQAGEGGPDSYFKELSLAETRQLLASHDGRALAHAGMEEDEGMSPDYASELLGRLLAA